MSRLLADSYGLGPIVRIGPNEVDISQISAVKEIHSVKGGYKKSPFYELLVPGTTNVFNSTDTEFHRRHRRILSSPLSESSIKTVESAVDQKVKLVISKMAEEMAARQVIDVAKMWLFMATDIISELSFGESFGMLEAGKVWEPSAKEVN
jgi:cytochrome P450